MADNSKLEVFFPINQSEQAKQRKPEYLLAQDVYKKIADLLAKNLDNAKKLTDESELDDHRAHEAILLEGGRGTGKSAILVNLDLYLQKKTDFAQELLILKPIDPTLLEDGDDMFLNIFIAALVRNKEVKKKLDLGGRDAENFYDQLNRLGSALEGSQGQKDAQGIDKIRALISSASIADQVHKLFCQTLKLVKKKLIVLPIDDVDTALQHAYEKIEIVRKYLTSPYTVPIISGDLDLYNEVIWRDIHGRLLNDSTADRLKAIDRAKELSIAYQRKILPLPRRVAVEELQSYLENENITLVDTKSGEDKKLISFPKFRMWIDALLNERINGVENSHLELPLETIREFAQLVSHLEPLFSNLSEFLEGDIATIEEFKRMMFMRPDVRQPIALLQKNYSKVQETSNRTQRSQQRQSLYIAIQTRISMTPQSDAVCNYEILNKWRELLRTYFAHHQHGGAIYLSLEANRYFALCSKDKYKENSSVFATDLFKPKNHLAYLNFKQSKDIYSQWLEYATRYMPAFGMKNFPETSILPYPVPEIGNRSQLHNFKNDSQPQDQEDVRLVNRLVTHHNFYSKTNQGEMVLTGRIVELLITSLIRNVTVADISRMIARPPFFSAAEYASTKTFDNDAVEVTDDEDDEEDISENLENFVEKINEWREKNAEDLLYPPQAWLIYNVINKYFNQAQYFNSPLSNRIELLEVVGIALTAYRAIWAIFASFEKGPTFGFDEVINYQNVGNASKNFTKNQLYRQNIMPFLQSSSHKENREQNEDFFNFGTGAYTYLLATHPLKYLLEEAYKTVKEKYTKPVTSMVQGSINPIARLNSKLVPILREVIKSLDIQNQKVETLNYEMLTKILDRIAVKYKNNKSKSDFKLTWNIAQGNEEVSSRSALGVLRRIFRRRRELGGEQNLAEMK